MKQCTCHGFNLYRSSGLSKSCNFHSKIKRGYQSRTVCISKSKTFSKWFQHFTRQRWSEAICSSFSCHRHPLNPYSGPGYSLQAAHMIFILGGSGRPFYFFPRSFPNTRGAYLRDFSSPIRHSRVTKKSLCQQCKPFIVLSLQLRSCLTRSWSLCRDKYSPILNFHLTYIRY